MRVVAGIAKGRSLRAPAGRATRPTSDRVREAIFSIVTSLGVVRGAVVVDLFAGSGALGIEALSRGAAAATFVDRDGAAVSAIRDNLAVLGQAATHATVIRGEVMRWLEGLAWADLVLADPPYGFSEWPALLSRLDGRAGLVVAESEAELGTIPGWETVKVKRYGGTVVTVVQPRARSSRAQQEGET